MSQLKKPQPLLIRLFITFSLSKKPLAILRQRERVGEKKKKNLAISSHQTLLGKKKTCATREIRFGRPSPSPFEFFRYVLLSLPLFLSMSFCCFDSVFKLPYDFGISFPCFCEFVEYSRFVLKLKPQRSLLFRL